MLYKNRVTLLEVKSIRGSTLLEVLISVFIMAFGIMALMLAQLKSVNNVREAEMQTRVAQAVQNLSAGMLSSPDVINNLGSASNINTKLQYTKYNTAAWVSVNNTSPATDPAVCGAANANAAVTNDGFIACIKGAFTNELKIALPNASNIAYRIASTNGATPTTTIYVRWSENNGDIAYNGDTYDFQYSAVVGD